MNGPRIRLIAACAGLAAIVAACRSAPLAGPRPTTKAQEPAATQAAATQPAEAPEEWRRYVRRPAVDRHGFTPVDAFLAKAPPVTEDEEVSLNPYVLQVIEAYPTDGSYPYRCLKEPEYDIYNGVTQDLWYRGRVVAKAHPNGSHCSYCCGLTFEILVRAMQRRNEMKGISPDDFNGMDFYDLFNLLQLWYIEGEGDSPQRGIVAYGLGRAMTDWEQAKPGDFCDFSRNNKTGHSVIFLGWIRDEPGKIVGMKYFSSQGRTGPGRVEEYFSDSGGKLLREWVHLARVGRIEDYRPFDRTKIPLRKAYAP